jgi:hypothetical protein
MNWLWEDWKNGRTLIRGGMGCFSALSLGSVEACRSSIAQTLLYCGGLTSFAVLFAAMLSTRNHH